MSRHSVDQFLSHLVLFFSSWFSYCCFFFFPFYALLGAMDDWICGLFMCKLCLYTFYPQLCINYRRIIMFAVRFWRGLHINIALLTFEIQTMVRVCSEWLKFKFHCGLNFCNRFITKYINHIFTYFVAHIAWRLTCRPS